MMLVTLACLLAVAIAGCSSPMKYSIDQSEIRENPHPTLRYEVTVTVEAPEPITDMVGGIAYTPVNVECVPKLPFEGARQVPNTSRDFKMTSPDRGRTWVGYFYRDLIEDKDYFGLGVCHWDVESVGAEFKVHGEAFGYGLSLDEMLAPREHTVFFKKAEFFDKVIHDGGANVWRSANAEAAAEVAKDPSAFFPMTIRVKAVDP